MLFKRFLNKTMKYIKVQDFKKASIITIDRPEKMNTFTPEMTNQLYHLLRDLEKSQDKKHVMIVGSGEKAFSAGIDLKEIAYNSSVDSIRESTMQCSKSMDLISNYKKPYTAIIDGVTMGAACFYSMSAKYRIATERTIFALPECLIGFFCNAGSSYYLSRLKYNLGFYIALAGGKLYGYDVKRFGLASHFVESKRMEDLMKSLVDCKDDSEVGRTISKFSSVPTSTDSEYDEILSKIDKCFDGDVEEIIDNLHLDGSEFAIRSVRALNQMSPTSMKICHRLLNLSKNLSLQECLQLEYALTINIMMNHNHDIREGVRALIIDKDLKPKWNPSTLHDVKKDKLDDIFAPLTNDQQIIFENRVESRNSKL